jgi:hypothetical protein
MDAAPDHVPNQIPLEKRLVAGAEAAALLAYGLHGLWVDDLLIILPRKHHRPPRIHFHGIPAIIAWTAIFMSCVGLVSVIVDHHDRRRNERTYAQFLDLCQLTTILLSLVALLWQAVLATITFVRSC